MKDIKLQNKLVIKLLGAITISIFVTIATFLTLSQLVFQLVDINYFVELSDQKIALMAYGIFLLVILNFIVVLLLLVRKK